MQAPLQSKCIEDPIRHSCPLDFHSYNKPVLLPLSVNNLEYLQKQFKSQCAMIKLKVNKPLNELAQHYFRTIERANLIGSYKESYNSALLEDIDKIIYNDSAHIVSVFKDYLIYDDVKSLIHRSYRARESKTLLRELIKGKQAKFIVSTFWLCENKAVKKANLRRKKIRRIKEEDLKRHESESTLFRSTFLSKLAKEDLSNSISKLPTVSLECSCIEDKDRIAELLVEFGDRNPVVSKWLEQKKAKTALAKTKFSIPCSNGKRVIKPKKVEVKPRQGKNQVPLNKRVVSCESQVPKEQESKKSIKPFSSNEHYFGHLSKKPCITEKSNSGIASIRSLNKIAIELSSEIKSVLKRESTLNPSLCSSKGDKHAFALSAESLTQINKKAKVAKKSNYFAIYNKRKNNCIKTPPSLARFLGNVSKQKAKIVITNTSKSTFHKLTEKLSSKGKQESSGLITKKGESKEKLKLVRKTSDVASAQLERFKKHFACKGSSARAKN